MHFSWVHRSPIGRRGRPRGPGGGRRAVVALVLAGLLAPVLAASFPTVAAADLQDTRCVVEPATSTGLQSGATAVAVGEEVRVGTELDLPPGPVHQDILANPDGSTFVASWIGVAPAPGGLDADLSSLVLEMDGSEEPLVPGTLPEPDAFVLDTSDTMARVYFPGDPAVIEDPDGGATVSFVVPDGGSTLRLSYAATVPDLSAGEVVPAGSCQAGLSDGDANAVVDERSAAVAVLGLDAAVAKSADLPVLAPSTTVTYAITVDVPEFDDAGEVLNGSAFDTVVTDVLPDGLDYVAGSASHGGVESGGVLTWEIAEIAAGESVTLTYQLAVPADAPVGAEFTNAASVRTTSLPGDVAGEGTHEVDADGVTLANGAQAPGIDKASDVSLAGEGQLVTYTVDLAWPAGSTWHDVTITDLLPDGMTLADAGTFSCTPEPCPSFTALEPFTDTGGNTRFGHFVEQLGPFDAAQAWRWTYTATMTGVYAGGAAVPLGTGLDNLAEVRFNLIPRLGGVLPNPAQLNDYDGRVEDVTTVTFDRPVVAIDKAAAATSVETSPDGVTYTVTLTNTGGVDAVDVTFTDPGPASGALALGEIDPASVSGATFAAGTFTVALVPATDQHTVTYTVVGAGSEPVSVAGDYTNTATVTRYDDPAGNRYTDTVADDAVVTVAQPAVDVQKARLSPSPIAGTDGETVAYRVTVINDSGATAYNLDGQDVLEVPGSFVPGTCEGGLTFSAAGELALTELAPGDDASCDYQVELDGDQPQGTLTNTVTIAWRNGFGQTGVFTPGVGIEPWTDSADATVDVVHPQLALTKGPDADTPGNVIVNGATATYTATIANVGVVTAHDVVLGDILPAGLVLEGAPVVDTTPAGIDHAVTGEAGDTQLEVAIPTLAPGALVTVDIPVRHDGVEPDDDQLVNTATLVADQVDGELTDDGVLQWLPDVDLPVATKTADPGSVGIGEQVTWTVTAVVPENTVEAYDVAFVDTLPDGLDFDAHGTVSCAGPLCATVPSPTPLAAADLSTGQTRVGWFVGDVPANTGPTTYTLTFTSTVASTYSGTGLPADGTPVTDTDLRNRLQPWLTLAADLDDYDGGALPDLSVDNLFSQFQRRGATTSATVEVVTPRVVAEKVVTNRGDQLAWDTDEGSGEGWMASAGDEIDYEVTLTNIGGATAHAIEIHDTTGDTGDATMLRDVVVTDLPAGVTVVDGWSLDDPDIVLLVDELAPDDTLTVTYTGVVAPSDELVPGLSGDNRDVAVIHNELAVASFSSAAAGGLVFEDTFATAAVVYVYTPSPYLTGAACVGGPDSAAGTTATFVAGTRNGAPPYGEIVGTLLTTGFPSDPAVGVGHDTTLTIVLSPDTRYVLGTAEAAGEPLSDPVASIDVDGVQTLVFALGDYAQGQVETVTFDVRTIADGVSGGMRATLSMEDGAGSSSRGTAVDGAAYAYEHAITRGCAPPTPITVRKFPDLSYRYEGQKRFEQGEAVEWFGSMFGGNPPFHDGEIIDTMPAGIDYTPGSAEFTVTDMDLSAVVASVGNGNLTEEITALPDGRTQLRWTSPAFAEFRSISYSLDTVVADDAPVGNVTNVIDLVTSDGTTASCSLPTSTACDNGSIEIISSAAPTIVKSVDHPAGPWGDSFAYTVDMTLDPNVAYFDTYIGDRGEYPRVLDAEPPFQAAAITCLSGCDSDPAPVTLPAYRDADVFARAWYLGDLPAQLEPRLYRVTYQQTFVDPDEYQAEFGVDPLTEEHVNQAVVGFNDADERDDSAYQDGGPLHTAGSSANLAVNTPERALDEAGVALVRPELAVDKQCQALDGRDDPATSSSFGGETPGSVPNFRCVLTGTNVTDPILGTTVVDPVLLDTLPTTSADGRPVTTQLISASSDEVVVSVVPDEDPDSPLDPPASTSLQVLAFGLELAPGESFSATVDLRVTADEAFWDDAELTAERSTNELAAESYQDTAGNAYTGDAADTWDLVIQKPDLTTSQRAWAGDGYEASLADGRPDACMAYADKPEPRLEGARWAGVFRESCTDFKDGRGHDSLPPGEYRRSYAGGVPDVILGATDRVTWAVDTAVVDADAFSGISVSDQIPYGFEYVPGSARLATWNETGTSHTPLADPVIGTSLGVTCSEWYGFFGGAVVGGQFYTSSGNVGQDPWTPLTWSFARGGGGAAGAFWDDDLSYLNEANRGAAGALDQATPFDRIVRIVFDVRPTGEFEACMQTPERSTSFRSQVDATGTTSRGSVGSIGLGWLVGVELARIDKTPDGAVSADGTRATYDIDVTITDPTRLDALGSTVVSGLNAVEIRTPFGEPCRGPGLPAAPTRTPWIGLGDPNRIGEPTEARFMGTYHGADLQGRLVVTDTFVDDGGYVPGSAEFEMFDPWGRPFEGHLASEQVEATTVDGRAASRITWTFDYYPSPFNVANPMGRFPCQANAQRYVTHPSSLRISVPLDIPDGTLDGTLHPNSAEVAINHVVDGDLVRTQGDVDDALVTVRNPQPPPPVTKTAIPGEVAPGATFDWVVEADLQAGVPWLDLGWVDDLPPSMEFLGYGTPTCVESGTTTPCSPALAPSTLAPIANPDGSTTLGWFVGDVQGTSVARTLRMPLTVRFVGDEVAGDQLDNAVTGFSNDENEVGTLTEPPEPASFVHTRTDVGVATVVEPSLQVTKVVTNGPGPFQGGDTVTYDVEVTNTGTGTAYDVPVSDVPDPLLDAVASSSPHVSKGWTALDPRLEWFIPTIGPGETVLLEVSGIVDDGYVASGIRELTNTATVAGYTSQPVSEEHARAYPSEQATATVPLVARNLTVEKYAGAECADAAQVFVPGAPVDWCVVIANTGDASAFGVTLTDLLPAGWTYETGSAQVDGAPVEPDVTTAPSSGERLVWTLGEIPSDTEHVITYRTNGAEGATMVANRAVANSTLEDGSPVASPPEGFTADGQARAAEVGSGLQIAKLPEHQRLACDPTSGCTITWEIVVLNADDADLDGATVTDLLPAGLGHAGSTTPDGWSRSVEAEGSGPAGTTPVTWTHDGTFASGEVATFEVTAAVPAGPDERSYLNHAVASAEGVPQVENQARAEVYSPSSLGDRVWHDLDEDGRQDSGEPGIAGVVVELHTGDGTSGAPLAATVTDADGDYLFADLEPGTYRVRFVVPEGWEISPLGVGSDNDDSDVGSDGLTAEIVLPSGTEDLTWDAGLFEPATTPPVVPPTPEPPVDPPAPGPGEPFPPLPAPEPPAAPDPPGGGAGGGATDAPGPLARTGADVAALAWAALVGLVTGGALLRPSRRGQSSSTVRAPSVVGRPRSAPPVSPGRRGRGRGGRRERGWCWRSGRRRPGGSSALT